MTHRLIAVFLILGLLMAGCSAANARQSLDAAEETVERRLDDMEDSIRRAVIPGPTEADFTVTQAQAENIALEHAGFTAGQVSGLRTQYEVDDGIPRYDVEFRNGDWEYEFEISAEDGRIISYDKDHLYD